MVIPMLTCTQPRVFFGNNFTGEPFADVERMFFMTESYGIDKWEERSRKGGIIFDRTRIMEYIPENLDNSLLDRIKSWNQAALVYTAQNL